MTDLGKLERVLEAAINQIKLIKNNNIILVSPHSINNTKESEVLTAIRKYLNSHYVRSEFGRIPTTEFHSAIIESLKESEITLAIRHIPILMVYVFAYKHIKSGGNWYYVGILPK